MKRLVLVPLLLLASCDHGKSSPGLDASADGRVDAGSDAPADAPLRRDSAPDGTSPDGGVRLDAATDASPADGRSVDAGDAAAAVSFSLVSSILEAHCTLCHDASKRGLPTFPELPLTRDAAYAALVGRSATEACGGKLVTPGHPESSYLYLKLTQPTPCDGMRMPRPFEVLPVGPLPESDLALIRAWIAGGARP
jgi:hypothetical protein